MTYQAHVLGQSPQLYLPWTEMSGSVFTDLSGNGHDATPGSDVVTAGGIDGAIRGERAAVWTHSFTDFGNVASIPCRGAFTWLIWARFPLTGGHFYRISTYQSSHFGSTQALIALVSNAFTPPYDWQFAIQGPGGDGFATYQEIGAFLVCWHHFALTWDGATRRGYKDGAELVPASSSDPTPSVWNTPNTPDTMSVSSFGGTVAVNHLAMYDRALSGAEIAADYAAAVPLNDCLPHGLRLTLAPDGGAVRQTIRPGTTERATINA